MPRQPRLDALPLFVRNLRSRSSSGIYDPAFRPGSSTGVLHPVMLRRTQRHSLVFAPWVLPQAISAAVRWQVVWQRLA